MSVTRFIFLLGSGAMFLVVAFWFGSMPTPDSQRAALIGGTEVSVESAAVRDELLELLASLQTINMDTSFLDTPEYRSLSDWGVTIKPQAVGRRNPFLPVGAE